MFSLSSCQAERLNESFGNKHIVVHKDNPVMISLAETFVYPYLSWSRFEPVNLLTQKERAEVAEDEAEKMTFAEI